jgi:glucose-1-phosphate thymidylyltransferase
MQRKGIILAGGSGTRLHPATLAISKQLLPVYDKPMIYYPLSTLMLAGIRDILVISTPQDTPRFEQLLGDGSQWGMNLQLRVQPSPDGLAQAFIIGERLRRRRTPARWCWATTSSTATTCHELLGKPCAQPRAPPCLPTTCTTPSATAWSSSTPAGQALSHRRKAQGKPKSNYAVTGLYFYDNQVVRHGQVLKPSARGELEITDLNRLYLEQGQLNVEIMGRGYAWLDTGTHDSLLEAGQFIATLEQRQGLKVACPEEIAWRSGWIDAAQLERWPQPLAKNGYGQYLLRLLKEKVTDEATPLAIPTCADRTQGVRRRARLLFESFNQRASTKPPAPTLPVCAGQPQPQQPGRAARPALPDAAAAQGKLVRVVQGAVFDVARTITRRSAKGRCVRWDDPAVSVDWGLDGRLPLLSAKDASAPSLASAATLP